MTENQKFLGPAARYKRDHPPVRNINELHEGTMTPGQRVADKVAAVVGSWPFIIVQSILFCMWVGVNVYLFLHPSVLGAWDPYPFILLNLVLSFQAAYTGPVVMMSQNRQADKDRLIAQHDYEINKRAEEEIDIVLDHLIHQDHIMARMIHHLDELHTELLALKRGNHGPAPGGPAPAGEAEGAGAPPSQEGPGA